MSPAFASDYLLNQSCVYACLGVGSSFIYLLDL